MKMITLSIFTPFSSDTFCYKLRKKELLFLTYHLVANLMIFADAKPLSWENPYLTEEGCEISQFESKYLCNNFLRSSQIFLLHRALWSKAARLLADYAT